MESSPFQQLPDAPLDSTMVPDDVAYTEQSIPGDNIPSAAPAAVPAAAVPGTIPTAPNLVQLTADHPSDFINHTDMQHEIALRNVQQEINAIDEAHLVDFSNRKRIPLEMVRWLVLNQLNSRKNMERSLIQTQMKRLDEAVKDHLRLMPKKSLLLENLSIGESELTGPTGKVYIKLNKSTPKCTKADVEKKILEHMLQTLEAGNTRDAAVAYAHTLAEAAFKDTKVVVTEQLVRPVPDSEAQKKAKQAQRAAKKDREKKTDMMTDATFLPAAPMFV